MKRRVRVALALTTLVVVSCSAGLGEVATGEGTTTTTSTTAATAQTPTGETGEAGVEAANDAVPPGATLEFETKQFELDDDGAYSATLVVPVGWEEDRFISITLKPPADANLGFFTSLEAGTGCDGLCMPTDWEQRLNGPDGYLTLRTDDADVIEQRDTAGSDGAVLITEDPFGVRVVVVRWDDAADHYFKCEAALDDDDTDLVEAFTAACEASKPDWIPGG